jgi:GPH family glycoside/pentoside/hexuronide:cation symporter
MNDSNVEKLHFTTKLAYGAGDLGPAITANISVFYLLFFLTDVAGLPAGLAGSVLMIGKISDAINDPIIGMLSDRTRTRWGRRLPWMVFGALPFGIIYLLQWLIPIGNQGFLFAYYVVIGILFNFSYTIINLPYQALTPELTHDYNERTQLNSFRFTFSIGGSILSLILYILISAAYPDDQSQKFWLLALICSLMAILAVIWCALVVQERGATPLLNPRLKKSVGLILTVIAIFSLFYGLIRAFGEKKFDFITISTLLLGLQVLAFGLTLRYGKPESHLISAEAVQQREEATRSPSIPFREQLQIVFNNRPFLYVIGIYLCSWLGVQLTASILVYYVVSYMKLPEKQSGFVALAVQGTALIMLFFWQAVSQKLDKKTVYVLGMIVWIVAQIGLFSLQPGQVVWMFVLAILAGVGVSVAYLIPWSMVPDVIELDELQTGKRREGIFYAFMVLLQKIGLALGLFLVGIALQAAGFKPQIPGEAIPIQPESALAAIRFAIAPLPAFFLIIGLILAYFYPITRVVHGEILLRLAERKQKQEEIR